MEQLDTDIYKKYTALQKQKQLDDELARKRDEDIKKFRDIMVDWVKDLTGKNEELRQQISDILVEQKKIHEAYRHDMCEKEQEVLRLNHLLTKDINNSIAAESVNRTPETLLKDPIPDSLAKKTHQSSRKAKKRLRLSKEATLSCSNRPEKEAPVLEHSRNHVCARGNETDEVTIPNMLLVLFETVFYLKISLNKTREGFLLSAYHEKTGYSFTLTWLERRDEWSYMVSSLGSLDSVATVWMKQQITFSRDMCPIFFQRISNVLKNAR